MNGSFDAKICHTDVKFHSVVQNNVKRNLSNMAQLQRFSTFGEKARCVKRFKSNHLLLRKSLFHFRFSCPCMYETRAKFEPMNAVDSVPESVPARRQVPFLPVVK